ncbi:Ig-like domain-containing protein [Clostridium novyi]
MSNNKTLKVFSSTAVAGMIAAAMMSSQAFAAVDAYSVKVGDAVYKYDKVELEKSFLDSKTGEKSALYEDFTKKLAEAKGFYGFNDNKNGLVDYSSIEAKFLEAKGAGQKFDVNAFTESKDAKVVSPKIVKKAIVKDGKVEYVDEVNTDETELKVTSIKPLNLKQVKIEFNQKIEDTDVKDDIEDIDNYTLDDKDGDEVKDVIKEVKLDDSKKFAILTFRDKAEDKKESYIIQNREKYTLTIDEDAIGKEVKKEINFEDLELPEIKGMEVVGTDTIKVKFSEPIMPANLKEISDKWEDKKEVAPILDKNDFDINDGDLSIRKVELVNNNTEANIIVTSDLKNGEKVDVKVKSSVRDYAGLTAASGTKTITVKEDKKAPTIVGYKDVESDEVTLIFDKDVKFADKDANIIDGKDSDLEKFYHTSDKDTNRAKYVKIDGKEVTIKFDEDSLSDGTSNIYVKSDVLESRWEVKNEKLSCKVYKEEDNTAPELVKVEQDKDHNDRIKIRFSEKVKIGKEKDNSALKAGNYKIKDEKGKEWKIKEIKQDGDSEKEFVIYTTKDLDEDLKYKLTVESVEDKAGNSIKKVTKDFKVKDNDPVSKDDIDVTVYSAGTNDQKIVVDFDSKMTMDGSEYSAKDLNKYTLISTDKESKFDGKDAINLSEVYKASIKPVKDGKAVEISIPGKDGKDVKLKDKQFNLKEGKLKLQISRVADANGNISEQTFEIDKIKFSGKNAPGAITFDKDEDFAPQAKSVEDIYFALDDKVNFDSDDIMVVAAKPGTDIKEIENKAKDFAENNRDEAVEVKDKDGNVVIKNLPVAKFKTGSHDGNTDVLMTLDKSLKDKRYDDDDLNHILSYDGKFALRNENGLGQDDKKLDVYVVVVGSETDNDYDETLVQGATLINDKIAPAVVDNSKRDKNHKYLGNGKYGTASSIVEDDEAVEFTQEGTNGSIVITFEENINEASVSTSSFELNKDDFKDAKIDSVEVGKGEKANTITLKIKNLVDNTKNKGDKDYNVIIEEGFEIIQRGPIKDDKDNEVDGLKLQIGGFKEEAEKKAKKEVEDKQKEILDKIKENKNITVEENNITLNVKNNTKVENILKELNVNEDELMSALTKKDKANIKEVLGEKTFDDIKGMSAEELSKMFNSGITLESGKKLVLNAQ